MLRPHHAAPWIDSTPSNQAIQACNVLKPPTTLDLAEAIIKGAFVDGRNISQTEVVVEIAQEQGFDQREFGKAMASRRVDQDLTSARQFAAQASTGFPAVFLRDTESGHLHHLGGPNLTLEAFEQAIDRH